MKLLTNQYLQNLSFSLLNHKGFHRSQYNKSISQEQFQFWPIWWCVKTHFSFKGARSQKSLVFFRNCFEKKVCFKMLTEAVLCTSLKWYLYKKRKITIDSTSFSYVKKIVFCLHIDPESLILFFGKIRWPVDQAENGNTYFKCVSIFLEETFAKECLWRYSHVVVSI